MKRLLTLMTVALLLAGCGWKGTGTVVERDHDRAKTTYTERCTTRTSGTGTMKTIKKTCKQEPVRHSAEWSLLVRDEKDGKEHWVPVSEREYYAHPEGSTYRRD